MAAFRANCLERRQPVIPPGKTHPVRGVSQDDSRCGWLTGRRRRLTARGGQPVGPIQQVFEWFYGYGAVAPTTGARFCRARPDRNAERCPRFIDAFARAVSASLHRLLLDTRGAHTAPRRTLPANVRLVCFPPSCPELNPSERVGRDRQEALAWQPFTPVDAPQDDVAPLLQAYDAPPLHSRTGDAALVGAIKALSS